MKLSVCIPTHNGRCALLEEALDSIAAQITDDLSMDVEIVVSDNAARDGTEDMVSRFASRYPGVQVVYGRNERDIRLANIAKAVERASGDWCWLFGSDDVMAGDGLRTVMRTIRQFTQATGIGFGKANFSHDMLTQLEQDLPAFYPRAAETTLLTGFAAAMSEIAYLHAYMGTNVVRRQRFLAAAERKGAEAARRHPTWPHLIILSDMLRHDPSWVWLPYILVKARAGRPYLVEQDQGAPNLARMHTVLADGLRGAWTEVAGGDRQLFRTLLKKSYAIVGSSAIVRNLKAGEGQTVSRDLTLLRSFTQAFWTLPEFRRRCLPLLLVPGPLWRAVARHRRSRAKMTRLEPHEINTRVQVFLPPAIAPRGAIDVRCAFTNLGPRALQWAYPFPVALGYRWFVASTGLLVKDDDRTFLPRPVAPGESIELHGRVNAPWEPGTYELRISPVQEFVVWFDDLDASNGTRVTIELRPPS